MTRRSSSNKKMSLVVVIALLMSLVAFIDSPLRANAQVAAPDAPSVPVVEFTADNGNLGYSFTAPNGTNDNGSAITQFNVRTYTGSPRQLVNGATCSIPSSAAIKKCAIVNDATNTYFQQGNNYEFSLSATNANGTSAETFVDEITFSATAPSSPTNLQATVTNDTATVSLQPPSATPNSSLNGGVALKSYRVDAYPANPRTSQSVGSCLIAASQQTVNGVVEETAGSCAINNLPIGSYVFSATATSKSLQVSAPSSDSNEVFVVGVSSSSTTVPTQAQQSGAVGASSTVPDAPPAPSVIAHRESFDIRILTTNGILVSVAPPSSTPNAAANGGVPLVRYDVSAVKVSDRSVVGSCSIDAQRASFGGVISEVGGTCRILVAVTCEAVPNPARPTDPAARGCKVIGAQLGISYSFKVFAINEFGDGDIAYSTARGTAFGMPSAPSNMRGVEGNPTIGRDFDVKWDPPTTLNASTIASYEVRQTFTFRNLNVNFHLNNQVSSSVICTVGAIQPRSCSAFMTNGNPISFDITPTVSTPSLDADGNLVTGTTNGPTGTFTFVPSGLPFAPASLSATAGDQSIVATWNEAGFRKIFGDWINTPGDGGSPITSYRVVAKNAANGAVESQCVVSSPVATGNRCTLMNLRNGTTYNISVVAVNVKGSSTEAVFNGVTPTK